MKKLQTLIGVAVVTLATVLFNLNTVAAPIQGNFDLTIPSFGTTTSNATVTLTNGAAAAISADKDMTVTITVTPNSGAIILRSNAVVALDALYGPSGTQRTTGQPMSFTVGLNSSNPVTQSFFVSRTNYYGCQGLAVDQFGILNSTNVAAAALTEVSINQVQ